MFTISMTAPHTIPLRRRLFTLRGQSRAAIATVIEEHLYAMIAYQGRAPQARLYDAPALIRLATGVPAAGFNCAGRARLSPANADAVIAGTAGFFRERRIPANWLVGPAAASPELPGQLARHGMTRCYQTPLLARDLGALPAAPELPGLTIELVRDVPALSAWAAVLGPEFGVPPAGLEPLVALERGLGLGPGLPWRRYLARLDGEPVATAGMMLASGVAGLFYTATRPEVRQRGIGAAISLAAMQDARDLGYQTAIVSASDMGLGLYHRLGFAEHGRLRVYPIV